jgi:hypothetical protein
MDLRDCNIAMDHSSLNTYNGYHRQRNVVHLMSSILYMYTLTEARNRRQIKHCDSVKEYCYLCDHVKL